MSIGDEMRASPIWTQSAREELANSVSHGIGLVAALIAAPILLLVAFQHGSSGFFIGTIIFTAAMMLVYLGSTLYHAWPHTRAKSFLQVLDHAAIFLLIAGTYTPFALGPLRNAGGLIMLGAVWALAIFGVLMKAARGPSRRAQPPMPGLRHHPTSAERDTGARCRPHRPRRARCAAAHR